MFVTDHHATTRLDSANGRGTDIDLEKDLGLDTSQSVARLGGYYWFRPRGRVDAAVFDLSRKASLPLRRTVDFGDQEYLIDTTIETESDLTILTADYTHALLMKPRGYLGITAGLYVAETRLALSEKTAGRFETQKLTAPLPLAGLRGDYSLTNRIALRGAVEWFRFAAEDVDGRFRDLYVGADYALTKRIALGLAYNDVTMNLGAVDDEGFDGRLNWGYDGVLLYFKYDFGQSGKRTF
jgi:hypothetical protein